MGKTILPGARALDADVIRALLTAAKANGLTLVDDFLRPPFCIGSSAPGQGWYASSSWNLRHGDYTKGGPWSVETVFAACERGLLGVDPSERTRAHITKAGRALIKPPAKPKITATDVSAEGTI